MSFDHVTILGLGLIGGSLAQALKKNNLCDRITGYDKSEAQLKKALSLNVIDDYSLLADEAVADSDLIVLSTPLLIIESLFSEITGSIKPGAVLTDVGSSKTGVVKSAKESLPAGQLATFVPGHPIAGKEHTGVEASSDDLFDNHLIILTPLDETEPAAIASVSDMWTATGALVTTMDIDHHDRILAATSHLPHMLAYALVDCLAAMDEKEEIFKYAAGGFADISRTASSSPEMWRDICLSNKEQILHTIQAFSTHLDNITKAIEKGDANALTDIFAHARDSRNQYMEKRN